MNQEILSKNGIISSILASNPPTFNHAFFCKVLLVDQVHWNLLKFLENQQTSLLQNLDILKQEILKLLMNQISSLKIDCYLGENITFASFLGADNCLKNLLELLKF